VCVCVCVCVGRGTRKRGAVSYSRCEICRWTSRDWPTRHQAGCEVTWHVYEEHRDVWRNMFGDGKPRDPDPRTK